MIKNGTSRVTYGIGTRHPTKKGEVCVLEFKSSREIIVQFLTNGKEITVTNAGSLAVGSVGRKKQMRSTVAKDTGAEIACNNCGTTDSSVIGFDRARNTGRALNCKSCTNQLKQELTRTPYAFIGKLLNGQKLTSRKRGHELPNYSTEELYLWAMNNNLMHYMLLWKAKRYEKYWTPSIDRVDSDKAYYFGNIRLIPWRNNQHLGFIEKSVGYRVKNLTSGEESYIATRSQTLEHLKISSRGISTSEPSIIKSTLITPLITEEQCEGMIRCYSFEASSTGKLFESAEVCCVVMGISERNLRRAIATFEPFNDWCYYRNAVPTKVI